MKVIFVDGYNVVNHWPDLSKIKDYSYESARAKLIEMLQNYASYIGCKIFLVFDAHKVIGSIEKKEKSGEVIVVFTKDGETADSFIERYVNNIGRKTEVIVVTSDSLEQQVTFQRGAIRMSSIEFYYEMKEVEGKISKKTEIYEVKNKNLLEDNINDNILEKLEKIRRSH